MKLILLVMRPARCPLTEILARCSEIWSFNLPPKRQSLYSMEPCKEKKAAALIIEKIFPNRMMKTGVDTFKSDETLIMN